MKTEWPWELAGAGLLDPLTLFEKLEFPNPKETAKRLFLWKAAPQMLFMDDPEVQQVIAQQQAQQAQQQQQQQQSESQKMTQQHHQNIEGKIMDQENKMAQIHAQNDGKLLSRVNPPK